MSSPTSSAPLSGAWRAVWRWHFYAGLLVMPFLMLLALTGGLENPFCLLLVAPVAAWTRSIADFRGANELDGADAAAK